MSKEIIFAIMLAGIALGIHVLIGCASSGPGGTDIGGDAVDAFSDAGEDASGDGVMDADDDSGRDGGGDGGEDASGDGGEDAGGDEAQDVCVVPDITSEGQCDSVVHVSAAGHDNRLLQYPSCANDEMNDNVEYIVLWTAPCETLVRVGLTNMDAGVNVDLFVLEGECRGDHCMDCSNSATDSDYVWFVSEAGKEYFLVAEYVDGDGGFDIVISCTGSASYEVCGNGIDDDGRFGADCEDLKCSYRPECGQPFCDFKVPIICGDNYTGESNAGPGASDAREDWCQAGTGIWTGPEMVYAFHCHTDCEVEVKTTSATDIDIFIMESCEFLSCISKQGATGGQGNESVTFSAAAFLPYYFVIDGRRGAIADYDIEVSCSCH
jgi:hypothetical protein